MNQEEADQDVVDEVIGHSYSPVLGDAYINFGFFLRFCFRGKHACTGQTDRQRTDLYCGIL